jgi:asparagine synthase (glutamine-hydrolysing)
MCGIAGLLNPGLRVAELAAATERMGQTLRHRGPDGDGHWLDEAAGLGLAHRRLAIVDLSATGAQPMSSASGRYVIAYNGEIYNFRELRAELTLAGALFRGGSDTEVMLAAIESWGLAAAVKRLAGMFAFALWDRESRTLSLVRDRLGIKPLYWSQLGGRFLFGSELTALRAAPGWRAEIDRNSLAAYLRWNYIPAPQSIYAGVHKLEPGCILTMAAGQTPRIEHYWQARQVVRDAITARASLNDDEALTGLDDLLRRAVASHMISDVPLGAFLSGGIDSSLVVALMQAQSQRPVKTFSIGFQETGYSEAVYAAKVARHLKTEHTELYVDPRHAREIIPRLGAIYDEPFADSSQLPTYLVSEMTRAHVTVALSGDGGDELFAGYSRYQWADVLWRRFGNLPLGLRRAIASTLSKMPAATWSAAAWLLPTRLSAGRLDDRVEKFAHYISQPDANGIYRAQHSHWPSNLARQGSEPKGVSWDPSLARDIPDFIERMQFMDMVQYLPDDVLTKVDRASMAVSLEARVPLLDHRVVEFAWRLPIQMKRRDGTAKWALRQMLYNYVPRELIDRPKMGFGAPIAGWLRGPLRDWAEALLESNRLAKEGFFTAVPITKSWQAFLAGDDRFREPLWGILMFQSWYEMNQHDAADNISEHSH